MRQSKYTPAPLLAEARTAFTVQGMSVDEALLAEVVATLTRLAPEYSGEDAQRWCVLSSEGGT